MLHKLIRGTALGVTLLLSASSSFGQAVYGSIFGTVTDTTGAVVPNATVTVTDSAKGTSVTATTNSSGEFTVEHLIPDPYDVKIAAGGFKGYTQTGIQLFADTSTKVAASLTIGDAAGESVTVSSDAVPQLKTDRADVSTVFDAREIVDLPIPDRNFTNLQLLLPGAQQLGWAHAASENPQASKQIQVDGQAFGGVAFELDGTDNQDPILGIIVINPNSDSLSETKITTQNFDAEFGKAVSSVVTAQTKSGTNSFHGSLFDYRESNANLARDPFSQTPSSLTPTNPFPQGLKNQFGGSVGGPIFKNKAFFFADYQGFRQKVGSSVVATLPTPLVTSTCLGKSVGPSGIPGCDFSEYLTQGHQLYQTVGTGANTTYVPYAGNVIPIAQLDPAAIKLIGQLASFTPNNAGKFPSPVTPNIGLANNYAGGGTGIFNGNQWDVRGDYQFSERVHAFGRFSRFTDTLSGKTLFGADGGAGFGLGGFGGTSLGANDSLALGADIAVNSKLVTDVRLGYYRYNIKTAKYDQGVPLAQQLGIPGENLDAVTSGAPAFNISDAGVFGGPNNGRGGGPQYGTGLNITACNCPLTEKEDQFQIVNNWTKTLGNHSVKFGADIRYARNLRVPSDNNRTGEMQFASDPTSNPAAPSGTSVGGLGLASFVLGDVTSFQRYVSTSTNAKEFQKRDFFYAQDTWRVTPKLTANLGLRYEFYFPETVNAPGNGSLMDLNTGFLKVAGIGTVASNLNEGVPTGAYNPRIGLAYQVTDKTVVRAGYGRSFDIGVFGSIFGHVVTQNIPVLANQSISPTGGKTASSFQLSNGPTAFAFPAVPSNGLLPAPGYAVSPKARPTTLRLPTIDAWNLSVQQSLTPTLSMTLAYVANKGTHTLSAGDGNNTNPNEAGIVLPSQYSVSGQTLHYDPTAGNGISANGGTNNSTLLSRYYGGKLAACATPGYGIVNGSPVNGGVASGGCGWTNGISYYGDDQDTHFNALQVSVAKQFTQGLSFNANYAWQRAFDFNSGYTTWDRQSTKGRSDSIRENQATFYGVYELPFGRNHMFLSKANPLVNGLVGGWQFSPVLTVATGLPFTLNYSECSSSIPNSAPCYVNGTPHNLRTSKSGTPGLGDVKFYDSVLPGGISSGTKVNGVPVTLCNTPSGGFSCSALDTIGNSGRNSIYGPGFFNGDLSLQKNVTVREHYTAQLRVDAFNGFNHINYGNPNGNVEQTGSITSGPGVNGSTNPRQLQFSGRFQF